MRTNSAYMVYYMGLSFYSDDCNFRYIPQIKMLKTVVLLLESFLRVVHHEVMS